MNTNSEENFNLALGRRILTLRQIQKIPRDHLAELLKVSSQQIYKYEIGENRMSPERIQACARIFKVPVGYFYGEEEDTQKELRFDKATFVMAAEMQKLPFGVRKTFYDLSREINKVLQDSQLKESKDRLTG